MNDIAKVLVIMFLIITACDAIFVVIAPAYAVSLPQQPTFPELRIGTPQYQFIFPVANNTLMSKQNAYQELYDISGTISGNPDGPFYSKIVIENGSFAIAGWTSYQNLTIQHSAYGFTQAQLTTQLEALTTYEFTGNWTGVFIFYVGTTTDSGWFAGFEQFGQYLIFAGQVLYWAVSFLFYLVLVNVVFVQLLYTISPVLLIFPAVVSIITISAIVELIRGSQQSNGGSK